jgi:hypothetical protein
LRTVTEFVRSKPKPTHEEAMAFALSEFIAQGALKDYGPYTKEDGDNIQNARAALEKHSVDFSEQMALQLIDYALEEAA